MALLGPTDVESLLCRDLGPDVCFLCSAGLKERTRSVEHVVPKWAQKRFRIASQSITLPNGTAIPYRQLTVPCCSDCNLTHLQPLETTMAAATLAGPRAVAAVEPEILFLWLGKLFYGLLYRDHLLPWDRSATNARPLMTADDIRRYTAHHLFLQKVRGDVRFEGFFPASLFVFQTQVPHEPELQWDLRDAIDQMLIAVRMGPVGIIGVLQDGGLQMSIPSPLDHFPSCGLHPVQYLELCAFFTYRCTLSRHSAEYVIDGGPPVRVLQLPQRRSGRALRRWVPSHYAQILSSHVGLPVERLFRAPDLVTTWFRNPRGDTVEMPLASFPWP